MKVKLVCNQQDYQQLKDKLEIAGIEISEDSQYVLYDRNIKIDHFIGKIDDEYEIIPIQEVVWVESFSHDIILHTMDEQYLIKEKLYQIEGMLEGEGFIRVNHSAVINKMYIKRIRPTFNTKFILSMKNGAKVDVTRSYYHKFKAMMKL